jgi:hypothetical protein
MSSTFTENTTNARTNQAVRHKNSIRIFDKVDVNQRTTLTRRSFQVIKESLARPLPYGNHAAAFAELLKSQYGEGN